MWTRLTIRKVAVSLVLATVAVAEVATAEPAWFWLSLDDTATSGPEVVSASGVDGQPRRVHIWAQPRTVNAGAYDPVLNPYLELANVSLNVVSPQSTFTIDPNSVEVYNPVYSTLNPRFEQLHDSTTGLAATTDPADLPVGATAGLIGLQGFTFDPAAAEGFGVACDASDTACSSTGSSGDAWLFASFTLTPTADTGTIELYLQVGLNGMRHVGEDSSNMEVQFGVDTIGVAPAAYDPSTDKQVTLPGDDADAVFSLVRPGDYNADGDVEEDDYGVWLADYGTKSTAADGNSDGRIDIGDYTVWRDHLDMGSLGSVVLATQPSTIVPEPAALVLLGIPLAVWLGWVRYSY